jgi:citrate lyase subunit beta/citryl-CoA lyase
LNDRDSRFLLDEVKLFSPLPVDGFLFPKAGDIEDIRYIDKLLQAAESESGVEAGTLKLIPIIETCAAIVHLDAICQASRRIIALAFGCEDFVADLRGIHDEEGQSLLFPRAQIAITARANGIIPIDTVHVKVHDLADLQDNLILARNLGFEGMLLLHPKEIEIVHRYFTPSAEEIAEAREIIRLTELANVQELGVAVFDNRFIGPPLLKRAHYLLQHHQFIENWEKSRS